MPADVPLSFDRELLLQLSPGTCISWAARQAVLSLYLDRNAQITCQMMVHAARQKFHRLRRSTMGVPIRLAFTTSLR